MGGSFEARTAEDAARALGVEIAELQALVDSGALRVLNMAGGGWITSDAAIGRAAHLRKGGGVRPRRPRGMQPRRRPATATAAVATPCAQPQPRAAQPTAPPPPAPAAPARRQVAVDHRRDVQPDARLDMREAATRLQCDERTATRLARQGALRATHLGRQWVTTESAVRDYVVSTRPPVPLPRRQAHHTAA